VRRGFFSGTRSGQAARIDLGQLPPGRYAISAYLDENGNRKLDSNWLGIPKEPVGASNNPRRRRGPPRFEDCAFEMDISDRTVSIRLEIPQ
jgi:4,4'-diapolycopenoate synthase